jgi:hypothetical protein
MRKCQIPRPDNFRVLWRVVYIVKLECSLCVDQLMSVVTSKCGEEFQQLILECVNYYSDLNTGKDISLDTGALTKTL